MKKIISLFVVAFLLSLSAAASAADKSAADQGCAEKGKHHKSDKPRLKFEDCDKNNTGALTFEEAQACWPRLNRETFDVIDTNKDGKITKQELKENRERHAKAGAH